jgi:hypothetical protein
VGDADIRIVSETGLMEALKAILTVIPAKAGIQCLSNWPCAFKVAGFLLSQE